jgi:hypothetical protein
LRFCARDFEIGDQLLGHWHDRVSAGVEAIIETAGEQAALQARGAQDGLLGQGDALEGNIVPGS